MVYTIYRNASLQHWTGGGGGKAYLRYLGVVSVVKFKTRVCLNRFCSRLWLSLKTVNDLGFLNLNYVPICKIFYCNLAKNN